MKKSSSDFKMKMVQLLALASLILSLQVRAADIYIDALVDASGRLIITTKDGRRIVAPRSPTHSGPIEAQVGFEQIHVSRDRATVGWVGLYPNVSYPIPRELTLFRNGRVISRIIGDDSPILDWAFGPGKNEIVLCQAPIHFVTNVYLIRQSIFSKRPSADALVNVEGDSDPVYPSWAAALDCHY